MSAIAQARLVDADQVCVVIRQGFRRTSRDDGLTLIEVMVSVMVMGVVMAALTTFFVSSVTATRLQGGRQAAVQLADDALERVRRSEPGSVIAELDATGVSASQSNPVAGVDLSGTQVLTARTVTVPLSGVDYTQHWYAGICEQRQSGGDCTRDPGSAAFYRIIVAVTWRDRACPRSGCAYVAATLISSKYTDPLFNVSGS